jgi:hypothetical protein
VKKESPSSEKSCNTIEKGWNWFKGEVKGAWEGTKKFFGDLWDWFTGVCAKMKEVVVDKLSTAWKWVKENIGYIAAGVVLVVGMVVCFVAPLLGVSVLIGMGLSFGMSWLMNGEITQAPFWKQPSAVRWGAIGMGIAGGADRVHWEAG